MLGLPYSLKTILHEMRGLFIPIWLCLAKIDEVEMFVKARNFLILGLDRIGREVVLEPEQVEEQSSPLPKEFLQRAEEGLEKNLQLCHKNAKTRLENMTPGVYTTLRRRKEDLPWLLFMRN